MLADIETYRTHPEDAWQRLKLRVKKPRQLAVLQALAAWREREAQSRDVPRGRVLKDDAIYEIALQQPRDAEALGAAANHPRGLRALQRPAAPSWRRWRAPSRCRRARCRAFRARARRPSTQAPRRSS